MLKRYSKITSLSSNWKFDSSVLDKCILLQIKFIDQTPCHNSMRENKIGMLVNKCCSRQIILKKGFSLHRIPTVLESFALSLSGGVEMKVYDLK